MRSPLRASLDARLAETLGRRAAAAPMPDDLLEIPDGWVRSPRSLHRISEAAVVAGVAVAATAATLVLLSLIGSMGEAPSVGDGSSPSPVVVPEVGVPIEGLDTTVQPADPAPSGLPVGEDTVEVARGRVDGRGFSYAISAGGPDGVCLISRIGGEMSAGCGALPGEGPSGGLFGLGMSGDASQPVHEVAGLVDARVAQVWIETTTEGRATAHLVDLRPAGVDAALFIVMLPAGVEGSAWVAADAEGAVLDRFATPVVPEPTDDGAVPTPAGP